jgi:hypothetical protein
LMDLGQQSEALKSYENTTDEACITTAIKFPNHAA